MVRFVPQGTYKVLFIPITCSKSQVPEEGTLGVFIGTVQHGSRGVWDEQLREMIVCLV